MMLDRLVERGEVASAGGTGSDRLLADRKRMSEIADLGRWLDVELVLPG